MKSKRFAFLIAFILSSVVAMPSADAVTSGAQFVRVKFTATSSIGSTAYSELVSSTVRGISAVSVLNTGSNPIALAFGASGSEVKQTVHLNTTAGVPAVVYPLVAGYATRISAISLDGQNSTAGELELNLFYN